MRTLLTIVVIVVMLSVVGIGYKRTAPSEVHSAEMGANLRLVVEVQPPPLLMDSPYLARVGFKGKGIFSDEWFSGSQWFRNCDSVHPTVSSRMEGRILVVEIKGFETLEFDTSSLDPSWRRR
jgi:hypothetical protein